MSEEMKNLRSEALQKLLKKYKFTDSLTKLILEESEGCNSPFVLIDVLWCLSENLQEICLDLQNNYLDNWRKIE